MALAISCRLCPVAGSATTSTSIDVGVVVGVLVTLGAVRQFETPVIAVPDGVLSVFTGRAPAEIAETIVVRIVIEMATECLAGPGAYEGFQH